ncbi:MAG: tRNA (guanine(10)-N(2))-dimethyltransferase [Thermoplasmata archaeon HGW-Thermoplasmata-1]|nr:MAG: tRNA (guanine(10)-N(2))-dimethyltransferase [Thermoplasmata archaeon HGW-Thermoplasmata-1]
MKKNFDTRETREGATRLTLPVPSFCDHSKEFGERGPGIKDGTVFYNPAMTMSRDISIAACRLLAETSKRPMRILDGLAASGARAVRIANECGCGIDVVANDISENAVRIIEENVRLNSLENVTITRRDLNALLVSDHFDYIDVDPFGSPALFVDNCFRAINRDGVLAITATDTAPLCGTYAKVCLRRYGARPMRNVGMHEHGIRILLGFIAREGAKHDRAIEPLFSYCSDHYFRTYVRVRKGRTAAANGLANIGYLEKREGAGYEAIKHPHELQGREYAGPLWLGELHEKEFVEGLLRIIPQMTLDKREKAIKLLEIARGEIGMPPFHYTTDEISSVAKTQPMPTGLLLERLREAGFAAARSHFSPKAFKTDADFDSLLRIFKKEGRV